MRALGMVALCATAAACFRPARTVPDLPPGSWTVGPGDAAHARYIDERVPASVTIEWDAELGRGLPTSAIVEDDLIISAVSGGGVVTMNAENGRRYWSRRFNGAVAGQVLRANNMIFFATQHRNGTLYALSLDRGRRIWSHRIDARAATEPVYADGFIYLGTGRDLQAVHASTGEAAWRTPIDAVPAQPPVLMGDELLLAVNDTLFRFRRDDGTMVARIALAGEPSAPIAMRGDTIIIAMHPGIVAAYLDAGARELWSHTLDAPVLAGPVAADDGVFVLTRNAELFQLTPNSARRIIALDGAATESLTMTADGALIGLLDGRLVFVRRDGTIVWEELLDGSVRAPAVVHDSDVYVGTLRGQLVKLTSG